MEGDGIAISRVGFRIHLNIVFQPSEGCAFHYRIQISSEGDIITFIVTNDRIGNQLENRIRVNRDGINVENLRLTTRSTLNNSNTIRVSGCFTILCSENLRESSLVSTFNQNTVTVPCEDLATFNATLDVSRHIDLITVTNDTILRHIFCINRSNDRFSNNFNIDNLGVSNTTGIRLVDNNMIMMFFAKSRSSSVSQRSSVFDSGFTIVPLIGKARRIPILESGGKSDLTIFANHRVGNRDCDNRSVIHIDINVRLASTTIFVHNLNAEVIRILAVILVQSDRIRIRDKEFSIVFQPSVLNTGRNNIHISSENNIIAVFRADDRIGNQLDSRIRVHRDGVEEREFRFTTRETLVHNHRVNIGGRITIHCKRSINIDVTRHILNEFSITIPSVDCFTLNTAFSVCIEFNASAFADFSDIGILRSVKIIMNGNLRNTANVHSERVDTDTIREAVVHQVCNSNHVCRSFSGIESLNFMSSTRNKVTYIVLILIPLEDQHRIVIIIQISTQSNTAVRTNSFGITGDVHNRFVINIHIERICNGRTTVTVLNFNRENQGVNIVRIEVTNIVVHNTSIIIQGLATLIPCVSSIRIIITINPSNKLDIHISNAIVAHIRVTVNSDDRITSHVDRLAFNSFRHTTIAEVNVNGIDIINRIRIVNPSLLAEMRFVSTRNHNTVSHPHISQGRIFVVSTFFILNHSRKV